jgi:hypothetical protein
MLRACRPLPGVGHSLCEGLSWLASLPTHPSFPAEPDEHVPRGAIISLPLAEEPPLPPLRYVNTLRHISPMRVTFEHGKRQREGRMPTKINERTVEQLIAFQPPIHH